MGKELFVPQGLRELLPFKEGQSATLKIKVDQTPVILPEYARHLSLGVFWDYLENTLSAVNQIVQIGEWMIQKGGTCLDHEIMTNLVQDPKFGEYLITLLRHGPEDPNRGDFGDFSYCHCASIVSDWMIKRQTLLEITPHRQYNDWGIFLKEGTIIVRGDVESVSGLGEAGLIYVDGQAGLIDSPALAGVGIVYVKGKINKLNDPSYMFVIAPAGIDKYEMPRHHASGRIKPIPPFIFSSKSVEGTRRGFERGGLYISSHQEKFLGINILPKKALEDWCPEEVRQKAENLVRKKLSKELDHRLKTANTLPGLVQIAEMFFEPPKEEGNYFSNED